MEGRAALKHFRLSRRPAVLPALQFSAGAYPHAGARRDELTDDGGTGREAVRRGFPVAS